MIPNENAAILFRFSEQRWIDAIINGELSFSCAGAFVYQAKATDNTIQGDKYEGIFAKLHPGDERITQMRDKLGADLEEISEDDYILLRRKSAMKKPIFCFYGYKIGDILKDGISLRVGNNQIRHDFDSRLYTGFSGMDWNSNVVDDSRRFTQLTLLPYPFVNRIKIAMCTQGLGYKLHPVDYELRGNDTFFIEPTEKYDELFYKSPEYAYQFETRICLFDKKLDCIFDRFSLNIGHLSTNEYKKSFEPIYIVLDAVVQRREAAP